MPPSQENRRDHDTEDKEKYVVGSVELLADGCGIERGEFGQHCLVLTHKHHILELSTEDGHRAVRDCAHTANRDSACAMVSEPVKNYANRQLQGDLFRFCGDFFVVTYA